MYEFIVDVGSILRERLLHHSSEPETLTIRIKDCCDTDNDSILGGLLTRSVMESILYNGWQATL